jgi:polysaccharide lyase-like protein
MRRRLSILFGFLALLGLLMMNANAVGAPAREPASGRAGTSIRASWLASLPQSVVRAALRDARRVAIHHRLNAVRIRRLRRKRVRMAKNAAGAAALLRRIVVPKIGRRPKIGATKPKPTPAPTPPPPLTGGPTSSANRRVYCLGSPTFGTGGFAYHNTSGGWVRQFPQGLPERVSFDSSVPVMTGLGCSTIKAELQANDPDPNGGTTVQRAQLYTTDSLLASHGNQPPLGTVRGNYRWYSFAFATNSGYRPQNSSALPNYNFIFSWHQSVADGTPNIIFDVASVEGPCGGPAKALAQPRIGIELNGGDLKKFPYNGATCRRFFGPTFVAGARYTVEMGVKWADDGTGSFEIWINGQQVANVANVSTLWQGQTVYPIFQNYRPGKSMIGDLITWTNTVYYAGLVAGASRANVALPSS